MLPVKLSPLHQIEYAIPNLEFQQEFFGQILKEQEVEASFSQVLSNPALDILHMGLGKTVQQFCKPLMEGLPHYDALQAYGPCVHNLCYLVDSIENMVANLHEAGFSSLIEFPLDDIWRNVISEDNLQGNHNSYIFETKEIFGFQLELAETPWIKEPSPPLMLPAFGEQWPQQDVAGGNRLWGMSIVVRNVDQTLAALQATFGENLKISREPTTLNNDSVRYMEIELGLVRMAYLQPMGSKSFLESILEQRGPAIFGLTLEMPNIDGLASSLKKFNIDIGKPEQLISEIWGEGARDNDEMLQIDSLPSVGVSFTVVRP